MTLNHLEDLVSASLRRAKIINMNQCVNLTNLYSEYNAYTFYDVFNLRNLKRIYTFFDNYDGEGSCLLEDPFKNSKLEYMDISSVSNANSSLILS